MKHVFILDLWSLLIKPMQLIVSVNTFTIMWHCKRLILLYQPNGDLC